MRGVMSENKIWNKYVRGSISVSGIVDKLRENKLK